MNVLIPTIGSRGDVQPFIALAQGLVKAGHAVTLASHPIMRELVESYAVTFASIGPDIDLARQVADIRQRSGNPIIGLMRGMQFSFDMLERSHSDILDLCRSADLVVVPAPSAAGKNEADLLNLPYLSVTLMPWAIPWDDPQRPLLKRWGYAALDGLISLITTRPLNRIRKRLGLPPVGREGFTSLRLNLIPISPQVYPPNPLWEPHHQQVGYWYTEESGAWEPEADLLTFLEQGDSPILISLGAMSLGDDDALQTVSLFVKACKQTQVRAIIQGWEGGIQQLTLPETVFACGSLPHSWLLPHCAGVVHHGGYGTTAAGLRAGIPALVIPHIADQFYWAQQVFDLGVGPKPIRRTKLEVNNLALALSEMVNDPDVRGIAATLGEKIRTEAGLNNAVQLIEDEFY